MPGGSGTDRKNWRSIRMESFTEISPWHYHCSFPLYQGIANFFHKWSQTIGSQQLAQTQTLIYCDRLFMLVRVLQSYRQNIWKTELSALSPDPSPLKTCGINVCTLFWLGWPTQPHWLMCDKCWFKNGTSSHNSVWSKWWATWEGCARLLWLYNV